MGNTWYDSLPVKVTKRYSHGLDLLGAFTWQKELTTIGPAVGQWGASAAYYNDYRYAHRPDEQLSLGRIFRIREGMSLQIGAEFFNAFNRTYWNDPISTNALQTQTRNAQGVPTAGFGRIDSGSVYSVPRNGQLVARFQF